MGKFFCTQNWRKMLKKKENESQLQAIVSEVQRESFVLLFEQQEIQAKLWGVFYKENRVFPVVGDKVLFSLNKSGASMIEKVMDRKSEFSRTDFSGHVAKYVKSVKEQVLAANFDYVFIVESLNKNFNLNRITRYVSITLKSGAKPIVVLTKADLCDNVQSYINQVRSITKNLEVCVISAKTGMGMKQLESYLKCGITIVLLGSSGVGKSTLVNAIAGEEKMKVSEIREHDAKGRHTTTHRQLIRLPSGVFIIDTPGIRELGLWDASEGIDDTFTDIIQVIKKCKFRNCTHVTEPGCAVKKAIENLDISKDRWKLYCQLKEEDKWGKNKAVEPKSMKRGGGKTSC